MVAIAIIAVALVSIMQLYSGVLRASAKARDTSTALLYARSIMEEAFVVVDPEDLDATFRNREGYEATRSAELVLEEDGIETYRVEVVVEVPPRGRVRVEGTRIFYAGAEGR